MVRRLRWLVRETWRNKKAPRVLFSLSTPFFFVSLNFYCPPRLPFWILLFFVVDLMFCRKPAWFQQKSYDYSGTSVDSSAYCSFPFSFRFRNWIVHLIYFNFIPHWVVTEKGFIHNTNGNWPASSFDLSILLLVLWMKINSWDRVHHDWVLVN